VQVLSLLPLIVLLEDKLRAIKFVTEFIENVCRSKILNVFQQEGTDEEPSDERQVFVEPSVDSN
jgi:hypothetical protein